MEQVDVPMAPMAMISVVPTWVQISQNLPNLRYRKYFFNLDILSPNSQKFETNVLSARWGFLHTVPLHISIFQHKLGL